MGFTEMMELYGTLGATGVISILFSMMILNLIRSQKDQTDDLDNIKQKIVKMETEINSTYSITVKLIDSINAFKNDINDKLDRRHDRLNESLDDLEKSVNYMQGRLNGK